MADMIPADLAVLEAVYLCSQTPCRLQRRVIALRQTLLLSSP